MKFKEICKTGYQVLLVTVTIIEAAQLGKSIYGKYKNRKATTSVDPYIEDSVVDTFAEGATV